MIALRTLFDRSNQPSSPVLPARLRQAYDGDLSFPSPSEFRPYVIGNFVSTLDGVVSYKISGQSGGGTVSGSNREDRFIMGLLRASVDAVVVGAGTVQDVSAQHLWTPSFIFPEADSLYTQYRIELLHKPPNPLVVIISGSGRLELSRAIFRTPGVPVVVITTRAGREQLTSAGFASLQTVDIRVLDPTGFSIDPRTILKLLHSSFGIRTLLHEGGPRLFGKFLAAQLIDELFLTIAPQIAGRSKHVLRPALVQGVEFAPETAPWFQLLSARQAEDHLYLRLLGIADR